MALDLPTQLADTLLGALDQLADVALAVPENLADLGLSLTVQVVHAKGHALLGRQLVEHRPRLRQSLARRGETLRVDGLLAALAQQPPDGRRIADPLTTEPVETAIDRDAVKPRLESGAFFEAADDIEQTKRRTSCVTSSAHAASPRP